MANEFKVKNGLIVDAGGIQVTGSIVGQNGITGSIAATNNVISGSSQIALLGYAITGSNSFNGSQSITGSIVASGDITGSNLRGTTGIVSPLITWSNTLSTNGGEIRILQTIYKNGNNVVFQYSHNTDSNGSKDLGFRRNNTGSLEIYDGVTADGAVANRRDLILRNITGSNAFFSGSVNITGSLTASLTNGYTWVGNGNNVSTLVSTSSFGGPAATSVGVYDFNLEPAAGTIGFIQDSGSNYTIQVTSASVSIFGGVTAFTTITSQSFSTTIPFTASLATGYTWVGGAGNISTLVATSSLGGGGSTNITALNSFTASQYVSNSFFATTGSNLFRANQTFSGSLIPAVSGTYDLGTLANPWRHIYVGSGSIYLVDGTQTITKTISAATLVTTTDIANGTVNLAASLPIGVVSGSSQVVGILGSLNTYTGSNDTTNTAQNSRLTNLETTSASVNISITNINSFTASNANVSLNTYTGSVSDPKFISIGASTSSLNAFTSSASPRLTNLETTSASVNGHIADINSKTGSYARTNSTNTFNGTQIISGALYITQDLVVQGSSSIQNISSSNITIGSAYVTLNTFSPSSRFAGLLIIDSGSAGSSGSLLYDSVDDEFVFVHKGNGTNITSSHVVMGPETYDNLGNEIYLATNRIPKVTNFEHIGNSNISDTGTEISLNSLTSVTGSFVATAGITGSIRATNGVISGSSQISLAGTSDYTSLFGGIAASTSSLNTLTGSLATTYEGRASATKTIFSGSSQVNGSSITTNAITIAGTSTALGGTITLATITGGSGVVSGSSQITAGSTTNFSTDVKTQLNTNTVVSGSSQITLSSTTGYGTVINQNLLTTSDVTHNSITGQIRATNGVISGSSQVSFGRITPSAIDYGSYGSIGVSGTTGAYAGISFSGVSGTLMMSSAASGFYYSNTTWRVYWDGSGNQLNTGDITAYASDKRLKKNIKNIPNALQKINSINGVTYDWKLEECNKWDFYPKESDVGVIAQEIQEVIPEAVTYAPFDIDPLIEGKSKSGQNYLTVQYEKLVPLLIEGMKEQQTQIEELKNKIEILINNLEK